APYRDLAARPNVPSKPSNQTCDDTCSSEAKSSTAVDHVRAALASRDTADCWTATWERHPEFDLFTVEFDGQGWLAGAAKNPDMAANQFSMLSDRLDDLVLREKAPLSMVMYTHGWHHSADPTDSNMSAFRSLLRDMVTVEKELCLAKRQGVPTEKACTLG